MFPLVEPIAYIGNPAHSIETLKKRWNSCFRYLFPFVFMPFEHYLATALSLSLYWRRSNDVKPETLIALSVSLSRKREKRENYYFTFFRLGMSFNSVTPLQGW